MSAVQYLSVQIGTLRPNPYNSNRVTAENERKIRESIRRNGLFKPIVVRELADAEGYEIIGGQHRWEQAKELGFTEIPIASLGKISDSRAKEIGLLDNARYGADDTLSLSAILKDIGDADEIQTFMPFGETDLAALFNASQINLDDLTVPEPDLGAAPAPEPEAPAPKVSKTHTLMRFKVSIGDAERLTALIARTQKEQGLTTADDLTNAGDALIHILSTAGLLNAPAAGKPADWDDMLDEIAAAQKEALDD